MALSGRKIRSCQKCEQILWASQTKICRKWAKMEYEKQYFRTETPKIITLTTQKSHRISNFIIFNISREKIVFLYHFDVLEPSKNSNFRFVLPNFEQVFRPEGGKMYIVFFHYSEAPTFELSKYLKIFHSRHTSFLNSVAWGEKRNPKTKKKPPSDTSTILDLRRETKNLDSNSSPRDEFPGDGLFLEKSAFFRNFSSL